MASRAARDPEDIGPDERIEQVDPEALQDSPFHHRTRWGDMRSFAKLLAGQGVIHALIVRALPKPIRGKRYEIVVGHRRKRGAIEGGLRTVPVVVREYEDAEVMEIQAIENMRREDLHPLDECAYFAELLDKGSHDVRSLSRRFTRSPAYTKARLRLGALSKASRRAYANDEITEYAAGQVCKLSSAAQQSALIAALKAKALDDDQIPAWIRRHALVALNDVPWALDDQAMPGGACSVCPKRTGAQREIFEDIVGTDDLCADPRCWRGKMDHDATATIERLGAEGHKVKAGDPSAVFLPMPDGRPMVIKSSGFLDAEADCTSLPGKTWLQAVTAAIGDAPTLTLMADQDGRLRYLLADTLAAKVRRAVRDEPTGEAAQAEATADPARAAAREHAAAVAKGEDDLVRALLGDGLKIEDADLIALVMPIVAGHVVAVSSVRRVARLAGLDPASLLAGDDAHDTLARVVALVVVEVGTRAPEVRALAEQLGVQLPPAEL